MTFEKKIAALFVDTHGVYAGIPFVDIWGIDRNAMMYTGNLPVICHPPCQLWGRFAKINYKRWGGDHNKPKNDGGAFKHALMTVMRVGGVLDHPAFTYAWGEFDLVKPSHEGWNKVSSKEWVCEVWQSAYGHLARKRTWLLYCGDNRPTEMRWDRREGTHQIGFHDQRGKTKNKPTIRGKKASATPILFRDALINLVMGANA